MSAGIEIRPFEKSDLEAIVEFSLRAWEPSPLPTGGRWASPPSEREATQATVLRVLSTNRWATRRCPASGI